MIIAGNYFGLAVDGVTRFTNSMVLVDNFVTMHGRRTFTGTRRVLASLIATQN